MHGHVHAVGAQPFQAQTMVGLEKAAALRQAAAVRRTLLRAAARELDNDLDDESRQMAEAWHHEKHSPVRQRSYDPGIPPEQAFVTTRVSYWV